MIQLSFNWTVCVCPQEKHSAMMLTFSFVLMTLAEPRWYQGEDFSDKPCEKFDNSPLNYLMI